jgi:glucosylceramidase
MGTLSWLNYFAEGAMGQFSVKQEEIVKRNKVNKSTSSANLSSTTDRRTLLKNAGKLVVASSAMVVIPKSARGLAIQNNQSPPPGIAFVTTTENAPWQSRPLRPDGWHWNDLDVQIDLESKNRAIEGFGACFNELGWTSLQALSENDRNNIFEELFTPGKGANFQICRMPVGANDFSRKWYSYDETPDDLAMEHFSIANDLDTLVPYIQTAKKYNPALRVWASPWSPPSWMKTNKHYAEVQQGPNLPSNGLSADQVGKEGSDLFIQEDRYFEAYAKYFGKFIDSYKQRGIEVTMVMPQNEFNSAQPFPSCTWTPEGLARFLHHLGPAMEQRYVEIFLGTYERGNRQLLDRVMADPVANKYIQGVGVQWAGKNAIHSIRQEYPQLAIYQSEQECGNGKNEWSYAGYCWDLMKHYLRNGTSGYMYWNLSLEKGGKSQWGWPQNSLVTVDIDAKQFKFNYDYYMLKHVSHFVQVGAVRLEADGTFDDVLAFRNPDKSIAVVLRNESSRESLVDVAMSGKKTMLQLEPDSISTLLVKTVEG